MEEAATPGAGRRMGWWLLPVLALAAFRPTHAEESTCDGVCGRRPLAGSHNLLRVVGGSNVLPGTWPWTVSFQILTYTGYFSICGGSLISPRWVLSAAHCFQEPKEIPNITLSIGANRISDPGPDAQRRSIKRLLNHKQYERFWNKTFSKIHNDISLVELNEPVNCTDYIQPACLPDESVAVSKLGHCYISGFGIMDATTKKMPDIMQEGAVDIIPRATCSSPDWWYHYILEENICAENLERGTTMCQGDSGGPLMCREQRSERYWVIGVTSWGPPFCGQKKKPGVYASTQFYIDWIRKMTKEDFSPPKKPPLMAQPRPTPRPHPPPTPQPQPGQNGNVPYPRPPKADGVTRPWPPPKTTPQTPPMVWPTTRPWPPPKTTSQTHPVVWPTTRPSPPPKTTSQTHPVVWPTTRPSPPHKTTSQTPPVVWPTTRPWGPPKTTPQTHPMSWSTPRPNSHPTWWTKGGGPRRIIWYMPPGTRPTGPGALTPPQRPIWGLTPPPWSMRPIRWHLRTRANLQHWHGQIYRPWVTIRTPAKGIQSRLLNPLQRQVPAPPGSQVEVVPSSAED
ncbi:acrosin-like [Podarcis raffonei]|uniref:acrosin-like n=1 Tax=Podarcis raffonei TaxID=65483 RepID=UPI002329146D|nr:acrosin-like [Podarcis raffonei]